MLIYGIKACIPGLHRPLCCKKKQKHGQVCTSLQHTGSHLNRTGQNNANCSIIISIERKEKRSYLDHCPFQPSEHNASHCDIITSHFFLHILFFFLHFFLFTFCFFSSFFSFHILFFSSFFIFFFTSDFFSSHLIFFFTSDFFLHI